MSKVSHLPKNFPPKEIAFKFKGKGSVSKHAYTGDFVVRVPQLRESSRIGIELAKLNDGIPVEMLDKNTAYLNNAVAYLRVLIVSGPAWFVNPANDEDEEGMDYGLDTHDLNIPIAIFSQAEKAVQDWYKALRGQPADGDSNEQEAK